MKKIDNPKEEGEHDVFDAASAADKKAAVTEAIAKKVVVAKQSDGKDAKSASKGDDASKDKNDGKDDEESGDDDEAETAKEAASGTK